MLKAVFMVPVIGLLWAAHKMGEEQKRLSHRSEVDGVTEADLDCDHEDHK
ncbi:hypothetical protein [Vibrio sp. F74]